MTKVELELLAVALFESQARFALASERPLNAYPWAMTPDDHRQIWRAEAKRIMGET